MRRASDYSVEGLSKKQQYLLIEIYKRTIQCNKARCRQADLRKDKTPASRASLSRSLKRLEKRRLIKREKAGRLRSVRLNVNCVSYDKLTKEHFYLNSQSNELKLKVKYDDMGKPYTIFE